MHSLKIALALLSVVAATTTDLFGRTTCSTPNGSGTCVDTSKCGGFSEAGYCPGAADIQCCISKTCSTPSGSGTCKNTSKKCSGGSFIAGYCPGDSSIQCCAKSSAKSSGGSGSSSFNGKISRSEIIKRAESWIGKGIPYNQAGTHSDSDGTKYRTDCSGFVSMALHLTPPGPNTVSLLQYATSISWSDLQPGDLVGTLGPGTEGNAGHVTLFHSWVDSSTKKQYNSLEFNGSGCMSMVENVGWTDSDGGTTFTSKPYKYIHVE